MVTRNWVWQEGKNYGKKLEKGYKTTRTSPEFLQHSLVLFDTTFYIFLTKK
jgi:hypothetical protein